MERYEKVKIVIEAIESGISKKKIYRTSNGLRAGQLHRAYLEAKGAGITDERELYQGGTIGDKLVDRMYENARALKSGTAPKPQTKSSKPTPKAKKTAKSPSPPGMFILLQEQVADLEQQLRDLRQQSQSQQETLQQQNQDLQQQMESLQQEVDTLQQENQRLQTEVDSRVDTQIVDNKVDTKDLYGFCLTQRKAGTGLNKYWYAGKRINGKLKWIYVGPDKTKAKQKIEAWLAKQPDTLTEIQQPTPHQQTNLFDLLDNK